MTEMKIRAWNKKVKRMFYFNELWICSEYDSLAFAYNEGQNEYELHAGHSGLPSDDLSTYDFMLYTTKKDKAGREIYQGDIVRYSNGLWVVQWHDDLALEDGSMWPEEWRVGFSFPDYENLEVIGNIYENPGLAQTLGGEIES